MNWYFVLAVLLLIIQLFSAAFSLKADIPRKYVEDDDYASTMARYEYYRACANNVDKWVFTNHKK